MTTTYTEAVDAIFSLFYEAWQAGAPAIVGNVPEIRWQGTEGAERPDIDGFWCMVAANNVTETQTTFKTGVEPNQNRRYTATGLVVIQLFCPMADSEAMNKGRQLAEVARNAFRGKDTDDGVWFRNARIINIPPEGEFYRINIIADYQFDDIG